MIFITNLPEQKKNLFLIIPLANYGLCLIICIEMFLLKILNKTVSLERSGTAQIMFQPTVPFVPFTAEVTRAEGGTTQYKYDIRVMISFPADLGVCQSQGTAKDCEIEIESSTYKDRGNYDTTAYWHKVYTITVQNSDSILYYLSNNYFRLRLKTSSTRGHGDKIFSDATLHDIQVRR